ncbi:MAG: hypothetical protein ACYCW5_00645 [Thermoleophilia bacterium]
MQKIIIEGKTYQLFDDQGSMTGSGVYSVSGNLILFDPADPNAAGIDHVTGEINDGVIALSFDELHAASIYKDFKPPTLSSHISRCYRHHKHASMGKRLPRGYIDSNCKGISDRGQPTRFATEGR